MQNFRKLKVWEKSHQLVLAVYMETQNFPREEKFGITSQLRRAASSVPANIAEGCGRAGGDDTTRFFQIALGSACETDYFLLLSKDLNYIDKERFEQMTNQSEEVQRMLRALIVKTKPTTALPLLTTHH